MEKVEEGKKPDTKGFVPLPLSIIPLSQETNIQCTLAFTPLLALELYIT